MKALCWQGKKDIRCETVPDPKIELPRDAIVEVTSRAICGSDLHLMDGFIPTMCKGDVLGHEMMGRIVDWLDQYLGKVETIAEVHRIFLHGPAQLAMTLALLLAAAVFRRRPAAADETADLARGLLGHTAALFVAFVVLLNRPAHMYALLFCPFAMGLFALVHAQARGGDRPRLRRIVAIVFVAAVIAGLGHHARLVHRNATARNELRHNEAIASLLPQKNVPVIAPLHFVFGQLADYRILGLAKYAFRDRTTDRAWDLASLADDAARHEVEYIVFERRQGFFNFDPPDYPEQIGPYERFVHRPPLVIYRRAGP